MHFKKYLTFLCNLCAIIYTKTKKQNTKEHKKRINQINIYDYFLKITR